MIADSIRDASRSADLRHRGFADTAKMQMLLPDAGAPTHYPRAEGTRASCLDHFLLSDGVQALGVRANILPTPQDSDHTQVLLTVADISKAMVLPAAHRIPERPRRLKLPAQKDQLLDLRHRITADLAGTAHELKQSLQRAQTQDAALREQALEHLGMKVHDTALKAVDMAYETLDHTPAGRKHGRHIPRKQSREIESLMVSEQAIRKCRDDFAAAKQCTSEDRRIGRLTTARDACVARLTIRPGRERHADERLGPVPLPPGVSRDFSLEAWADWANSAEPWLDKAKEERSRIIKLVDKEHRLRAAQAFRHLLASNPKKAHAVIAGKGASAGITALRRPDGTLATSQDEMASLAHSFFRQQAAAPATCLQPWMLPWQDICFDGFDLVAEPLEPGTQAPDFMDLIADRTRFMRIVHNLANGKAAGPDGVPNEVLKYLSDEMLDCLHLWIQVIFKTAQTPACMKQSTTVLLHKKGDPTSLSNYRPICLINTLGKLYTALLADCMQDFCDQFGILSASQEGFRRGKSTARQLKVVVNALTDAKLTHQDIYALFVDFFSAFNTVYHDKLFSVLRQLGFPESCIAAVTSLYDGSTTMVQIAGTSTEAIPINRGTLQGDSLSPLLFILAIEPLMRWLHVGGRGYSFGCTDGKLRVATAAYADDLLALAPSAEDLNIQAGKIQRYSDWIGLRPNVSKCAVSAALHGGANGRRMTNPYNDALMRLASDRLQGLKLAGATPPFLHPHRDSYRYLGVDLTLSLDWKHHVARTLTIAQQKGDQILSTSASPNQVMRYRQSAIRPCLTCACPVGAFANADMSKLDAAVCRVTRTAWRVPQRTQTALVLRGREDAGMGQQSMMVDYVQILASSLTQALNDKGPLGESTRALLKWQQRAMGGQQTAGADYDRLKNFLARKLRPMHLVWQLGLLHRHGVVLQGPAGFDLEISGDCLAALRPQETADQPQSEVCRSITKYLTDLCGCCVGEQPFTLTRMDMAVTRVGEHLMMRPLSHVRLLCGDELADKHRHAYNRPTTLLNTGEVTTSQRARDLPELDRLVSEEAALARFCACDLEDLEEEADVLAADAVPRVMPGQATPLPASGYEKGLRDLYERQSKAETRLRSKAALKQVSAPAPAKKQGKRARSESEAPRRSVRLAGLPDQDYDQEGWESAVCAQGAPGGGAGALQDAAATPA